MTVFKGKTSEVDVLIIGAGPSGLMMALWMAKLGIKARIVDKRPDCISSGHADGLNPRTMEILDSFGIGERVWQEANPLYETSFWSPFENGWIRRTSRTSTSPPGLSRFDTCVLHQGRIETFFIDAIRETSTSVRIDRKVMPLSLKIDEDELDKANTHDCKRNPTEEGIYTTEDDAYPIEVRLHHLSDNIAMSTEQRINESGGEYKSNLTNDNRTPIPDFSINGESGAAEVHEIVRTKYLIGCDGAHSWVRKALGDQYEMVGETTDSVWGVLDIVPITDFPDIRVHCIIRGADGGTVMVIPRENRLVRLYIWLKEVSADIVPADRSKATPEAILETARRVLFPYSLEYHYLDWWSTYQIGQRSANLFSKFDRIFLAGDAVHTHSPKAGQGMNVSIQDTFNLGWKLGLVCKKVLSPQVLTTYELERRQIAKQLIAFDEKYSQLFMDSPVKKSSCITDMAMTKLQVAFQESQMFATGIGVRYEPNALVSMSKQHDALCAGNGPILERSTLNQNEQPENNVTLALSYQPGTRFPSQMVLCQADGRPSQLAKHMPSNGRFRVVVFGGDISRHKQLVLVNSFGGWLSKSLLPRVPILPCLLADTGSRFHAASMLPVVDVLLVHSAPRECIDLLADLDEVFHPFDARLGWHYGKSFVECPKHNVGYDGASQRAGFNDESLGRAIVVRPDGYIGLVTSLHESERKRMEGWFDTFVHGITGK